LQKKAFVETKIAILAAFIGRIFQIAYEPAVIVEGVILVFFILFCGSH
jgi:hypothetical protein